MLKKAGKKLESAVKDMRDEANAGILRSKTEDQRAAGRTIKESVEAQLATLTRRVQDNKVAWEKLASDKVGEVNQEKLKIKLNNLDATLTELNKKAKAAIDKYSEISARPNDGSTSASRAKEDCDRMLSELNSLATSFDRDAQQLSEALSINIAARENVLKKITDRQAAAETDDFLVVDRRSVDQPSPP